MLKNINSFTNLLSFSNVISIQCHYGIIPIYFDHKLADGLSTFQKLLRFGTYPLNQNDICIHRSLINNCEVPNIDEQKITNLCNFDLIDIPDDTSCPISFYKNIEYKYKEIPLPIFFEIENEKKKKKRKYYNIEASLKQHKIEQEKIEQAKKYTKNTDTLLNQSTSSTTQYTTTNGGNIKRIYNSKKRKSSKKRKNSKKRRNNKNSVKIKKN
jgi:hypothetical protein